MKKQIGLVLLLSVLWFCISLPNRVEANSSISVSITQNNLSNYNSLKINIIGEYIILQDSRTITGVYEIKALNDQVALYKNGNLVKNYGTTLTLVPVIYGTSNYMYLNDHYPYLGEMTFTASSGKVKPKNTLLIEDYLKGVVPKEMSASRPIEALKAQAVAARTYAMGYLNSTSIKDTVENQVFGGFIWVDNKTYYNSTQAVDSTRGEIITYNGVSIKGNAFFYSSNGGMMLTNKNTWGTTALPYFNFGSDPYDANSSNSNKNWSFPIYKKQIDLASLDQINPDIWWNITFEKQEPFMNNIKKYMYDKKLISSDYQIKIVGISNVDFTTKFSSNDTLLGNINIQYALKNTTNNTFRRDENGKLAIYSYNIQDRTYNIRSLVGASVMKSPYIKSVNKTYTDRFEVNGGGYGHGIGMSQYGAYKMAETRTYKDILKFYYPNTAITVDSSLITTPPVKFINLETDKSSPQKIGNTVQLTANATGGNSLLYKFSVNDGKEWKMVRGYSPSNTLKWTPKAPGNYKFSVHVKDKYSSKQYDVYKTLNYTITSDPIQISSVSADKVSPQNIGTPIEITATAIGGNEKLYRFWMNDGAGWKIIQDYSAVNTYKWIPGSPGEYKFSIHVKDKSSNKEYDAYMPFQFTIDGPVKLTSLTADKSSPQPVNSVINISANATGGLEKVYRFNVFDGNEWKVAKEYSVENTFLWKPSQPGDYRISVYVKDSNSNNEYDDYKFLDYKISTTPVKAQSLTANVPSPQPSGKYIKLTANATGGTEKLYKFFVYDGKQWKVLRDYQTSNTYTWVPTVGKYKLVVHVKDRLSQKAYDSIAVIDSYQIVQAPVKLDKVNMSVDSPQVLGSTIKLIAIGTGGTTRLYKFNVYDGKQWIVARNYTTSNTFTWTPSKAGNYKFSIHVKDAKSTKAYDAYRTFDYVIAAPVKMVKVETDKVSPQAVNTAINVTAMATGGTKKLYKFHIFENNVWKVVQDYSPSNQYLWKPQKAGEYKISVHVKDQNSSKSYDSYGAFEYSIK